MHVVDMSQWDNIVENNIDVNGSTTVNEAALLAPNNLIPLFKQKFAPNSIKADKSNRKKFKGLKAKANDELKPTGLSKRMAEAVIAPIKATQKVNFWLGQ